MRRTFGLLLVVLVLGGCGTDDDAVQAESSPPPETAGQGLSSTVASAVEADFCSTFDEHSVEITGVGVAVEPDSLRDAFESLMPALDSLDESAPPEIEDQVVAVGDFLREYARVLEKYDFSYDRVLSEGSSQETEVLSGGGPIEAMDDVTEYVEANCPGVTVPE